MHNVGLVALRRAKVQGLVFIRTDYVARTRLHPCPFARTAPAGTRSFLALACRNQRVPQAHDLTLTTRTASFITHSEVVSQAAAPVAAESAVESEDGAEGADEYLKLVEADVKHEAKH